MRINFIASMLLVVIITGVEAAEPPATADGSPATKSTDDTNPVKRSAKPRRRQTPPQVLDPDGFAKLQTKSIFSGPQPNEKVPEFTATTMGADGNETELSPLAKSAGKPLILIFQDETGVGLRGLLGLSRTLKLIGEKTDASPRCVVVFLGDDPISLGKTAAKIRKFTDDDFLLTLSNDGRDGPGALGLNRNVAQTILLINDGVVKRNFAMTQAMLRPDPYVLGGIAELFDIDRKTMSDWLSAGGEKMRMRRKR
ncbi:MAG: hypothetical protein AAF745_15805 [Planctomycetota bacterium]